MRLTRLAILAACAMMAHAQERVSVRILLGATDTASADWSGSVKADGATVESLEPWRFEGADAISGSSWKASTHQIRLFGGANLARPVVANGVIGILAARSEDATVRVTTAQGNFDFKLSEIPYGATAAKLNGKALVDRVPAASRLTETTGEEDFPSAAVAKDGSIWLAYSTFHHHPDHNRLRVGLKEPLKDFSTLKAPPGGDQIFVRRYSNGNWEQPIAVTPGGGDLYCTAIAIDGNGKPWVFWSQNNSGNFDIFGCGVESGKAGLPIQISKEKGSDIDPVATTDSTGKVWVAWQGWRNGKAEIFAAIQKGSAFSATAAVSKPSGNEWNPAIAADRNGHVTVAWDSYRNGNYDVYLRTATVAGAWGAETAVAATPRYEAYPSIAYDGSGRLWVAYEEGGLGWGKDFGAYNTEGIALYQGRAIRIRGFEPDGRRIELAPDVGSVLLGMPRPRVDLLGRQSAEESLDPKPETAKNRARPTRLLRTSRIRETRCHDCWWMRRDEYGWPSAARTRSGGRRSGHDNGVGCDMKHRDQKASALGAPANVMNLNLQSILEGNSFQ